MTNGLIQHLTEEESTSIQGVKNWPAKLSVLVHIPLEMKTFNHKGDSMTAHSLSLPPSYCPDMTDILIIPLSSLINQCSR